MRTIYFVPVLILALTLLLFSTPASAEISVVVAFGPPPLPVYVQPPCPAEGYLWVPGYWAYADDWDDYYWVPGTWVLAPEVGYLWTPPYWAWNGAGFVFYDGYWGPQVGFYGGIAYGFGYFGEGYDGGRWDRGRFYYNSTVNNVNTTVIHNVYQTTINNTTVNRVSYNGGNGGVNARPSRNDEMAMRERHIPPVAAQTQHVQAARSDSQLRASFNQGRPPVAATPRPGAMRDSASKPAERAGGRYEPPARHGNRGTDGSAPRNNNERSNNNNEARPPVHPRDLPPRERPAPFNTGNQRNDRKYQQQQDKLYARQQQEQQKLEQRQERDHQQLERQRANDSRRQQVEQRHQQQTQRMEQRQTRDYQKLEQKQHHKDRGHD